MTTPTTDDTKPDRTDPVSMDGTELAAFLRAELAHADIPTEVLVEVERRLLAHADPTTIMTPSPTRRRQLVDMLKRGDKLTVWDASTVLATVAVALRSAGATFRELTDGAQQDAEQTVAQATKVIDDINALNERIDAATRESWERVDQAQQGLRQAQHAVREAVDGFKVPSVHRLNELLDVVDRCNHYTPEQWARVVELAQALAPQGVTT